MSIAIFTLSKIRHPEVRGREAVEPRRMDGHIRQPYGRFRLHASLPRWLVLRRQRDWRRFIETHSGHQSGIFGGYTSFRLPVELVWSEHFERITDAIAIERKLKGWSRRKKEALIRGDWVRIRTFAKRPTARS
jgi:predicted GIY-YIG superfamily endonuclease